MKIECLFTGETKPVLLEYDSIKFTEHGVTVGLDNNGDLVVRATKGILVVIPQASNLINLRAERFGGDSVK